MSDAFQDWLLGTTVPRTDPVTRPRAEVIPGERPRSSNTSFEDWLEQDTADPQPVLDAVQDVNPDEAARNRRLSNQTGYDLETVQQDPDAVELLVTNEENRSLLLDAPATQRFLSDPVNASIAHDDVRSMSLLEHTWASLKAFSGQVIETPGRALQGIGEIYNATGRALERPIIAGLEAAGVSADVIEAIQQPLPTYLAPGSALRQQGLDIRALGQAVGPDPSERSFVSDVAGGLGQLTAQITAALLTGGVSSAVSLATLLGQGASIQADLLAEAEVDPTTAEADAALIAGAGITAITERFGLDNLLNKIPGGLKSRILRILAGAGSEGAQEIVEGVMQNMAALALYDPEMDIFEGVQEEGAVAATVGAIASAIIPGRQAIARKKQMDSAQDIYINSALNQRDPEKAAEHQQEILKEIGVPRVFVPADKLAEFAAQEGSPVAFYRAMGVGDQIEEALLLGTDVELSGKQFSQFIMGSENYASIADHVRFDENGMTAAEADELAQSGVEEELAAVEEEVSRDTTSSENEAVDIATAELGLRQLFRSAEEAGMTDKQYASYLESVARAAETSGKRQEEKILRQRQRENTKAWQKELAVVEEQVRENLSTEPVYAAVNNIGRERLDRARTEEILKGLGEDLSSLPTQSRNRAIFAAADEQGTLDPDAYAQLNDFADAETMFTEMITRDSFEDAVFIQSDIIMRERHGDLLQERQAIAEARVSLHNDTQGAVLAQEVNALRTAQAQGRLKPKLIKLAAQQRIQQYQVSEVTANKFLAAERRLGRQAAKELRAGDRAAATRTKTQQLLNFEMAQQAFAARARVDKQRKWMKRFNQQRKKFPSLPVDYLDTLRDLLSKYDLGAKSKVSEKDLQAWADRQADATGDAIQIEESLTDPSRHQNWQDMTLAEFDELYRKAVEIHHKGVTENKLRKRDEKRTRNEIAGEIANNVYDNLTTKTPDRYFDSVKRFGEAALTTLFNVDTIAREVDGFQEQGAMQVNFKGRYDRAMSGGYNKNQIGYLARQKQEAKRIVELYSPYSKRERVRFGRNLKIPGVARKVSKQQQLAIMLNMGNQDNIDALLDSGQYTEAEINAITDAATEKDWKFVQSVWDYLEEFWPEVRDTTIRRKNYRPQQVQAKPLETKFGTFRGGYYPLRYDKNEGIIPSPVDTEQLLSEARFGEFVASHTRDGHTKERVGSGGRPLLLDLFVLNAHVDQVTYDLEVGDAITDMYKVLNHRDVKKAFSDQGHLDKWRSLELWLGDVVSGEMRIDNVVENSLRWLRSGFTVSKLGWNFGTAALQPLGLLQTAVQLGKRNTWEGLRIVLTSPQIGDNSIYTFVSNQTAFMQEREENWNKDIIDARRQLSTHLLDRFTPGNTADVIRSSFFWGIKKMQKFVDAVTWLGAKKAGMEQFDGDAEKANAFADRMVARSQASGIFGERTQFERGTLSPRLRQSEMVRAFTPLISYFMAKTNVAYERTRKTNFRNPGQVIGWVSDMMLLYTIEALLVGLIRAQLPDEDDDETIPEFAAAETIKSVFAGVPFVREVINEASGFRGGGIVSTFSQAVGKTKTQFEQGEIDEALLTNTNNLLGMLFKYPSSQVNKTARAIAKRERGEEVDMIEFVMGPHFER